MEFSNLSDPSRHIWIVTTAALPWRTGTSINPFLRALHLVRHQRSHICNDKDDIVNIGKVTLVIPWIEDIRVARKLYGDVITEDGDGGREQQLAWIRDYASRQCGMDGE